MLQLKAKIEIKGVNPYVLVRSADAMRLRPNWRKPMPVLVQINGKPEQPWHINMMPIGTGDFYLYLHNDVRQVSQTKVGDMVDVQVWFDESYRNGPAHDMPPAFETALHASPLIRQRWDALPPSRQKEVLRYFAALKSPEALDRNIIRAVNALSSKQAHFMGRDWVGGK